MAPEPGGLYVHVPFCERKCVYCHFAIDPRRPDDLRQERYTRALLAEIEAAAPFAQGVDTLYFGGGTPSLLSAARLGRVIAAARARFALPAAAEITLEANPKDLDRAGYAALRALGVSRLSLGVQSLDDAVLAEMQRSHDAADAREAVAEARAAGFANVSLDLILGWPGESPERFRATRDGLLALQPDHVSVYVLEVSGKTALAHRAARGQLTLPDDDLVADLYLETVAAFAAAGLRRYEISNFARAGFESRHNEKYWLDAEFAGFGMSAHGWRDGRRSWNLETWGGYVGAVEARGPQAAVAGFREVTPDERVREALFTGLRRAAGIDLAAFRSRYGVDVLNQFAEALAPSFAAGLLFEESGHLRLTDHGALLSNEVFAALV
ncbi:MAG: radical SAM family heme chaperone HemW [Vicinamibacteria bacterium]|nr:radical SAM family heme chaperone HemW [Vicinamibacteria bacterium]